MSRHPTNSDKRWHNLRAKAVVESVTRTRRTNREDNELVKFFDWVRLHEERDPRLKSIYHVGNERKTSPRQGAWLKRKGVRAGIPDVVVPIPMGSDAALYVELKIKPNKLSDAQGEMCTLLHCNGNRVRVAWSGDELIKIVTDYLYSCQK